MDRTSLVFVKTVEKRRVLQADLSVDAKTEIVPATDPVAVVQCCGRRVAIMNERFVITAAGANRTCPAGVTVITRTNVVRIEKSIARRMIDAAFVHVPHLSDI